MVRSSTPANDPRYDSRWKMPGYTGHICSVSETIAATPVAAQVRAIAVPYPTREYDNLDS